MVVGAVLVWVCEVIPGRGVLGEVDCAVVDVLEVDGAGAWRPVTACEYSMVCCRVDGRRRGILVYVRNIALGRRRKGVL